jgi:hypothetical protein
VRLFQAEADKPRVAKKKNRVPPNKKDLLDWRYIVDLSLTIALFVIGAYALLKFPERGENEACTLSAIVWSVVLIALTISISIRGKSDEEENEDD